MVKMIELDHRIVVVGGLIVACLFYQVPFFTVVAVIVCGCAVYGRNRYKKGDRVSLGLTGIRFVRQTRSVGRLRPLKTPPSTIRSNASMASTPKNQTWGSNLSFGTSPVSSCGYGTYSPYRDYNSSRILQARLNQGSPKMSPECSLKVINSESPSFLQKQATGSMGGKPDISANKPDTSYNDICQAKYVGVGIYPTVHLEPSLPHLLSNFNSTMTKSRVTVKVAPREKASFHRSRFQDLRKSSADTYTPEGNMVIDALKGTRKRSIKDDVSEAMLKRQRVETKSATQPYLSSPVRFLPNGIDHRFNSHLCDESMLILPPHFASEHDVVPKSLNRQLAKKHNVTGRDSIESSYSSSKKMTEKAQRRLQIKRKPEPDSIGMPDNKVSRNKMSPIEISSSSASQVSSNLGVDENGSLAKFNNGSRISLNPKTPDNVSTLDLKSRISPVLGSRNSSSMYIPSYIPTLDDYLQDKILNEQRLQKMLSAIAGKDCSNKEYDAAALQAIDTKESSKEPLNKTLESQLPTTLDVTTSTTAPVFSFGKPPSTGSASPSLTKSNSMSTISSAPDISQSKLANLLPVNLPTMASAQVSPQAPATSLSTPTLTLKVANSSTSIATTASNFAIPSNLSIATTTMLPVVTNNTMSSSAPTISSPFNTSFVMSTPAVVPYKPSTNLITPISSTPSVFSFGDATTSSTASAMNSSTTTVPPVPFSKSANLNFGNAVSASLNTSTVASVTNPLFSFGSSDPKPALPTLTAGAVPNSFGVSTPSLNPTFSMTSPVTSVPSMFGVSSLNQAAGTASSGFQFNPISSQATTPLNDPVMKENATSGMMMTSAVSSFTTSPFGLLASNNNVVATCAAPSIVNAVGSKPLVSNTTTTGSLFQQGSSSINPNSQSASGGFSFGLTQNATTVKNTASLFASPNASQGVNPFVTSQPLTFGTAATSQASSFGNNNASTNLVVSSNSSSGLSTGIPFAFGNGSPAIATKSFMGGQLGMNDGTTASNSAISLTNTTGFGASNANNSSFGVNNAGFGGISAGFGANAAGFGSNNAGFGTTNTGFETSSASFGAGSAGFGSNSAGFGANSTGFGGNNAGFAKSNATNPGFATSNATNAGFASSNATNVGFGANNTGFATSNATNAGFAASNATNAGFAASNATNAGFATSNVTNAGFAASNSSNAGFGTNNVAFTTSNTGNAGFGTNNAGFGGFNASTGFGAATINGNLPPSYGSSAENIITTFGGNTKPTSTGGFNFGNSLATTTAVFGNSSAVPPNSSTSFQFNGPPLSQSNTNLFSAPSNNNENNNTTLGSPFNFKGQSSQVASNQGFSFNPGAQPSFNFGSTIAAPSTSSMFSIGTGSVAPRLGKTSARQRINR